MKPGDRIEVYEVDGKQVGIRSLSINHYVLAGERFAKHICYLIIKGVKK